MTEIDHNEELFGEVTPFVDKQWVESSLWERFNLAVAGGAIAIYGWALESVGAQADPEKFSEFTRNTVENVGSKVHVLGLGVLAIGGIRGFVKTRLQR